MSYANQLVTYCFRLSLWNMTRDPFLLTSAYWVLLLKRLELSVWSCTALNINYNEAYKLAYKSFRPNSCIQCRAFAKALHYKEMEFEGACSNRMDGNPVAVVEALIHINNQLHQHEVVSCFLLEFHMILFVYKLCSWSKLSHIFSFRRQLEYWHMLNNIWVFNWRSHGKNHF